MTPRRIALLVCDTPIPSVREDYGLYPDIFRSFLSKSLSKLPVGEDVKFELDSYDVTSQQYPSENDLEVGSGYNAIMITGSGKSSFHANPIKS